VTLILVHTAHPQAVKHAGPGFGRLLSPRHYARVAATAAAGIPWAADNDCYSGFNERRYRGMLEAVNGLAGCRFVVAPDAVGDWHETRRLWDEWADTLAWYAVPLAYVLQDGQPSHAVPWEGLRAVFIGGTTDYKLGGEAERLAREARERGLWVHMGRVNSRKRYTYARQIGCDSVDGGSFSRWRDRWLPAALEWHRAGVQLRLPT
jgi:hypothetical protein